jgi:hypothetical protein
MSEVQILLGQKGRELRTPRYSEALQKESSRLWVQVPPSPNATTPLGAGRGSAVTGKPAGSEWAAVESVYAMIPFSREAVATGGACFGCLWVFYCGL